MKPEKDPIAKRLALDALVILTAVGLTIAIDCCRPACAPVDSDEDRDASLDAGDAGADLGKRLPSACARACDVLAAHGCEEALPARTSLGEDVEETCAHLCERAIESGHPMPTSCLERAKTKSDVEACGVTCAPAR